MQDIDSSIQASRRRLGSRQELQVDCMNRHWRHVESYSFTSRACTLYKAHNVVFQLINDANWLYESPAASVDLSTAWHSYDFCATQPLLYRMPDVKNCYKRGCTSTYDKKAVLSQRWPRDARYISRSWAVEEIWPFEIIQDGGGRRLECDRIDNSAIRSAVPENPTIEPNRKWIRSPVAEIWPFTYLGGIWNPHFRGKGRS